MTLDPEKIPAELRGLKRWVLWRLEDVGRPKKTKVPYTIDGRKAKTTDERDWASFGDAQLALAAGGGYSGVGFVFTATSYVGVDLDDALGPDGPNAVAAEFLGALAGAYVERSQSGAGLHFIARGALPAGGKRKDDVEMYDASSPRYFAITGDVVQPGRTALPDLSLPLAGLHKKFVGGAEATAPAPAAAQAEIDAVAKSLVEQARGSREARRFFALFDAGEFYEGRRSEADFDLAKILWRQPGATENAVVEAMAASALFRDKWKETRNQITLLRHTVRRARPGGGAGVEAEANVARSVEELLKDPNTMRPPLAVVPRLAWQGRTTLLAGREKWAGKSTLLTAAAAAVTRGRKFFGETCPLGSVLWVSADLEPEADVAQRLVRFGGDPAMMHVLYPRAAEFDGRLAELEAELTRLHPSWVVIDTMAHFAAVEEASQSAGWVNTLIPLRRVCQKGGAAVTLVHHAPKGASDEYRDSTAIGGAVDQVIIYRNPDRGGGGSRREAIGIGRIVGWRPFETELVEHPGAPPEFRVTDAAPDPALVMIPVVLDWVRRHPGSTAAQAKDGIKDAALRAGLKTGAQALQAYVQAALDAGVVRRDMRDLLQENVDPMDANELAR